MQKNHARVGSLAFILATALFLTPVSAQERCKVNEVVSAANSQYTEQHTMDVGDVPGRQIRILEIKRTYPDDKTNCEGLKRTQSIEHGMSDYYDCNGAVHVYGVITYENGDKIFEVIEGVSQTVTEPDGSKKGTVNSVIRYTGGTGKYANVRGLFRSIVIFDIS